MPISCYVLHRFLPNKEAICSVIVAALLLPLCARMRGYLFAGIYLSLIPKVDSKEKRRIFFIRVLAQTARTTYILYQTITCIRIFQIASNLELWQFLVDKVPCRGGQINSTSQLQHCIRFIRLPHTILMQTVISNYFLLCLQIITLS
ncbi:hypothetical protein VNO77_06176 [Canavalia gladiata]|uniref:Uncharacterized protein n=1 Tax=Canavalia gladiata TaxID=3824 RepID=A0AAN9M756_CANGL